MSTYIIAIGGTGSKIAESIVHAVAMGVFIPESNLHESTLEDLHILFVDPDKGNGNLSAADTTLKNYQTCSKIIGHDPNIPWMRTKISEVSGGLLSPFNQLNVRLKDVFKYDDYSNNNSIKHLFDVLYTKEEREVDLKEGFRGKPSIGAAVMTQVSQHGANQDSWTTLIDQIETDYNSRKTPKVFLCGSIFGGTGASGFPTLGQMIANELGENGRNILRNVKLGGLLMLPYFQFKSPPQKTSEKQIFARSEEFLLKTEAALRYYRKRDLKINPIYLLGTPSLASAGDFSTGGASQRNPQHYLELYGALALRDFIFTSHSQQQNVVLLSRKQSGLVTWEDIPDRKDVRVKLLNSTRFAFAWLSAIVPDIDEVRKIRKQRAANWSLKFFQSIQEIESDEEQDNLNAISTWCKDYLQWIGNLHFYSNEINLLNTHAFLGSNGELKLDRKEFTNLPHKNEGTPLIPILEKLSSNANKINSPNIGFVGLAKTLYFTIAQN